MNIQSFAYEATYIEAGEGMKNSRSKGIGTTGQVFKDVCNFQNRKLLYYHSLSMAIVSIV